MKLLPAAALVLAVLAPPLDAQAPVRPAAPVLSPLDALALPTVPEEPDGLLPVPGVTPPDGYVIGPEDLLSVIVWRDRDLSAEVRVRPDGMVSLPLLNDVVASGLSPEQLRLDLTARIGRYVADPSVTVIVREINSRKVFITGAVGRPGPYTLGGPMTVLQLIISAGGLSEFADAANISVLRAGREGVTRYKFNYRQVARGVRLEQNFALVPGDTVIVP